MVAWINPEGNSTGIKRNQKALKTQVTFDICLQVVDKIQPPQENVTL